MAKSKPIGVRFDLDKLDIIQKEQNLTSVQQVVNYLMDNYGSKEVKRGAPFKNMPPYGTCSTPNLAVNLENGITTTITKKTPPDGLKGIDLVIWKSENWK
jgi:hypothetical protein